MSFVTGLLLIDAPAAALNNLGGIPGERDENTVGVKAIRTKEGLYPYVSAQSFRYWQRMTLAANVPGWRSAPMYREEKVAYTDGNPLQWWDDDLFGYMRVPSQRESAKAKREADTSRAGETETKEAITRAAPFRVSTLVSVGPVNITNDFGTMSRHDGDPVPHEHQFYRTTLQGLFSLNLHACGTFSYRNKSGFRNLDDVRIELAKQTPEIEHLEAEKSYRLPRYQRRERIKALFEGMARLEGGAKQTLHYTDVAPVVVVMAVTKGGNHIFGHIVGANRSGHPEIKTAALEEALTVFNDELLSDVYVGWVNGYLDEEHTRFESFVRDHYKPGRRMIHIAHPRVAFDALVKAFDQPENDSWLD